MTFIICLFICRYRRTGQQCWPWSLISEGMSVWASTRNSNLVENITRVAILAPSRPPVMMTLSTVTTGKWLSTSRARSKVSWKVYFRRNRAKLIDGWSPLAQKGQWPRESNRLNKAWVNLGFTLEVVYELEICRRRALNLLRSWFWLKLSIRVFTTVKP